MQITELTDVWLGVLGRGWFCYFFYWNKTTKKKTTPVTILTKGLALCNSRWTEHLHYTKHLKWSFKADLWARALNQSTQTSKHRGLFLNPVPFCAGQDGENYNEANLSIRGP